MKKQDYDFTKSRIEQEEALWVQKAILAALILIVFLCLFIGPLGLVKYLPFLKAH